MLVASPPWLTPSLTQDTLYSWLHANQITVTDDPHIPNLHAVWDWNHKTILLSPRLPKSHRYATLTHEAVHIYNQHTRPQPQCVEQLIDQAVANAIIDFDLYRYWEGELGGHPGGIAKALEQPLWLITAYQHTARVH